MTGKEVTEELKNLLTYLMERTTPEDDPLPCGMAMGREGVFYIMMIDRAYFNDADTKENLVVAFRKFIKANRAMSFAWACPMWFHMGVMRPGETKEEALARVPEGRVVDMPRDQREEGIMIWSATQFERSSCFAPIIRHEGAAPTLGEWGGDNNTHWEQDRFGPRIQAALVEINT